MLCFSLYAYNTSCGSQRKDNQLKDNQEITSFSRIPASNFAFLSLSLVFPILRLLVVYASIDSSFPCIANVGLEGKDSTPLSTLSCSLIVVHNEKLMI
jgi:hypothetical protein